MTLFDESRRISDSQISTPRFTEPPSVDAVSLRLHPWACPIPLPGGGLLLSADPAHRIRYSGEDSLAVQAALASLEDDGFARRSTPPDQVLKGLALLARDGALIGRDAPPATQAQHTPTPPEAPTVLVQSNGYPTTEVERALDLAGCRVNAVNRLPEMFPEEDLTEEAVVVRVGRPRWEWIHGAVLRGITHLVISPRWDSVRVGPLVVPGSTPCLRCLHLARADRDPVWPWIADRLEHLPLPPAQPALMSAAGLTAAALIRRGEGGTHWVLTREGIGAEPSYLVPHPMCGCWWPQAEAG